MEDIWLLQGGDDARSPAPHITAPAGAVHIIEDLVPLDAQSDTTTPLALPPTLRDALFGPMGDTTPGTFAILDAAKIPNLADLLGADDLTYKCLYTGEALENLADVAPYVVKLHPDSRVLRRLFTQTTPPKPWDLWAKDAGIFLRSDATLDALWAHFRKFTKVRMDGIEDGAQGDRQFFRFYDPEQAALYFDAIRAWPDRMVQFFRTKEGDTVDRVVAVSSVTATAHVIDTGPLPADLAPAPFVFQPRDRAVFAASRRPQLRLELHDWLRRMDPPRFKPFSSDQLYALVDHGLREGDALEFTFKEEYVYLLYMMTYLGGWFHKSGRLPEITRILQEDGRARRMTLEKAFPQAYDRLYGSRSAQFRDWAQPLAQVQAQRMRRGGWHGFTPDAARHVVAQCARRLGHDDRAALDHFLDRVALDCDQRGIVDPAARGIVLLMSYVLGHGFFEDPLFPWAAECVAAHDSAEAAMPQIADYALKRMGKMTAAMDRGAA